MAEYIPDGWVVVKIDTEKETFYKIFGSWRGGYLDGDSWRMNSGVVRCEKEGKIYKFYGHSGSCYACHESGYRRLGPYNEGVLQRYVDRANGQLTYFEEMPEDILTMEWE